MTAESSFDSLLKAIDARDQAKLELFVQQGADVNRKKRHTIQIDRSSYDASFTPLMLALRIGNLDAARALLDAPGIEVNAKDDFAGGTALIDAAKGGHTELVKRLLALGADVDAEDTYDTMSAPAYAIQGRHTETAEVLIRAGVSLSRFGPDLLARAASTNNPAIVELLLEKGVPPGGALRSAAFAGHAAIVEILLDCGASLSKDGEDALLAAASGGHTEILRVFASRGVSVECRNSYGWTPLLLAAWGGKLEMVKTLLALGADPALGDENGKTAADWAREGGKAEVAALLESAARAPSMCQRPGPRFSS